MTDRLVLDNAPGTLTIGYVTNDPWTAQLDYRDADGNYAAWPSAPVLEFASADVPDWTATLSTANSVADSRATWNADEAAITLLHGASNKKVRLVVGGVTWYAGRAQSRA